MAKALASRHMGKVVKSYRTHPFHQRSFSQETVGTWAGISQTAMSVLETGPPSKDLDSLCHWAAVLEIPEHLLWFSLPPSEQAPFPGSDDVPQAEPRQTATVFVRRIAVGALHNLTLHQLDHDVARLVAEFVPRGPGEIRSEIHELQIHVFKLIETNRIPEQLRRLFLAASRLCGLAGHAYRDLGAHGVAARQAEAAWLCAELADHPPMLAWLRALQSLIAIDDGRFTPAISLARDGARYASAGSLATRLAVLESSACAAAGDPEGSHAALARADSVAHATSAGYEDSTCAFAASQVAEYTGEAVNEDPRSPRDLGAGYLIYGDLEDARRVALTRHP